MKKVLLSVLATVCIMGTGCAGYVEHLNKEYHDMLEECDFEYDSLKGQYDGLQEQVWNVLNDENYTIRIKHEGEVHTFTKEKENFLFTKKSHVVTK